MLAGVDPFRTVIDAMAAELCAAGLVGVTLGGSRSRGDHVAGSDWDLGLYYRGSYAAADLTRLASQWSETPVAIGEPGTWGPWVDAGGWLTVRGEPVDWILRDLDRVEEQWSRACRGDYAFHRQPGHPLGFLDVAYVGELAQSQVIGDPTGTLSRLADQYRAYPEALVAAFESGLWEADFILQFVAKGVRRGDAIFVNACLAQCTMLCAHAVMARARRWVTNEKGLVPAAGADDPVFAELAAAVVAAGPNLAAAVGAARALVEHVRR